MLDLAQGSPLIAQAAAALAARGQDLGGLTADDALRRRFDELVSEALGSDNERGRDYLAVVAGLGRIDNNSADLQSAVRAHLRFDESVEARLASRLTNAGVVQRGYSATRIIPDVLADHLLSRWFLDPSTRQYDFRSFILEPFLRFKAKDILLRPRRLRPVPGVRFERDVAVPMRDGVRLMANVFRPEQAGRYPVVMSVSPYGKDAVPEDYGLFRPSASTSVPFEHPTMPRSRRPTRAPGCRTDTWSSMPMCAACGTRRQCDVALAARR